MKRISTGIFKLNRSENSARISEHFLQFKAERERERERERELPLCLCISGGYIDGNSGIFTLNPYKILRFVREKCRIVCLLGLCCLSFLQGRAQTEDKYEDTENKYKTQYLNVESKSETDFMTVFDGNLLVKTNAAYLGAGISNLGFEYSFSERLSLDFPLVYSPYTVKNNWKIRLLGMQPEIRIWAGEQLKGHFAGFHAHIAWYNVAVNNIIRYQDHDGKAPLLGFGLTYGYALRGDGKWGLEFAVGAGYAQLQYDVFNNVPNGAMSRKEHKNYWGITKIGISLSYKLISKKQ